MIVSVDHAVGLISALSVLALIMYGFYSVLAWIVVRIWTILFSLIIKSSSSAGTSKTMSSSTTTTKSSNNIITIGLLLLAYELSPLLLTTCTGNTNDSQHGGGLYDIVKGTNEEALQQILQLVPSILKGPTPPLFFSNRHIQFIPWMIQNEIHNGDIPYQRIDFEVSACLDKTQLPHCTTSPFLNDTITLDIFPPFDTTTKNDGNNHNQNFTSTSPIIFFQPGLRSFSQDLPGNMIVRRAYAEGFRSVVVNRRGHTPGRRLKAPRWNLFGDVEDFEQVYWYIKNELAGPNTPLFLHGISSGTAVTVSSLAKWDKRRTTVLQQQEQEPSQKEGNHTSLDDSRNKLPNDDGKIAVPTFVASISVTPGYDISRVMVPQRFRFPYNDLLVHSVKEHFLLPNQHVLQSFHPEAFEAAMNASTLQEFVDLAAPFAGYDTSQDYYQHENPVVDMHHITTPKLVLNAVDDPCCHIQNLYEQSPYTPHDGKTYDEIVRESPNVMVAVTQTGSHCPFLDGQFFPFVRDPLYGGWMLHSWADTVSIDYYKAALQVYGDRRFL